MLLLSTPWAKLSHSQAMEPLSSSTKAGSAGKLQQRCQRLYYLSSAKGSTWAGGKAGARYLVLGGLPAGLQLPFASCMGWRRWYAKLCWKHKEECPALSHQKPKPGLLARGSGACCALTREERARSLRAALSSPLAAASLSCSQRVPWWASQIGRAHV